MRKQTSFVLTCFFLCKIAPVCWQKMSTLSKIGKKSKNSIFFDFLAYFSKSLLYIRKYLKKKLPRYFDCSDMCYTFFCQHTGVILQQKREKPEQMKFFSHQAGNIILKNKSQSFTKNLIYLKKMTENSEYIYIFCKHIRG